VYVNLGVDVERPATVGQYCKPRNARFADVGVDQQFAVAAVDVYEVFFFACRRVSLRQQRGITTIKIRRIIVQIIDDTATPRSAISPTRTRGS